ncbi:DUF955 domain-containing protein [Herminiimonas sp. KBW02]|uniref:ImmA/IrrE family metallo-endopeptidase n=1 Tax=Herminiimonas sp. KBW02 TaxID=2153363 RepID=UPI000F5AFC69|nr:ImmA/IrrE family metallo-endopeptidase [Herminiimonas sp. KBW02]RQO37231.1 DUF955 domain-containing protein [Herminiimonas sp. KBW02]
MAKNLLLSSRTSRDIDAKIERVLNGLGNPEPPIRLEDVRALLNLDLKFYTATDPGFAEETISRIRVATIQVYKRPTLLIDAIKKMSLKALYLPDRKRIMLDGDIPEKKHRWNEAHEIGHSLIPWHDDMMHGDNTHTVSHSCHEQIEAEANFAAGRLLFLRDRFLDEAFSVDPTLASVRKLHGIFGNTLSTTLYRFVECVGVDVPMLALITGHPHSTKRKPEFDEAKPCRHFIRSPAFMARFSKISEIELFKAVAGYCGPQSGGPLGATDLILTDDNGENHRFKFETFFNRYDGLTLGTYLQPEQLMVAVS